jgi:hypothetical protein
MAEGGCGWFGVGNDGGVGAVKEEERGVRSMDVWVGEFNLERYFPTGLPLLQPLSMTPDASSLVDATAKAT